LKNAVAALFPAKGIWAVQNFLKSFVREQDGAWMCIEAATLDLPSGRIQVAVGTRFTPGTPFMGADLVRLLEERRLPGS
jgi:hypothetical protein